MTFRGSRRVRLFLNISAHLVVLGILFQIAAFDHWQMGFQDVQGVEGSSAHIHASHCHGEAASCADAGGAAASVLDAAREFALPVSALVPGGALSLNTERPDDVIAEAPTQPPQAA